MKRIICFEGTSGSGKSTLCELTVSYLNNCGTNAKKIKFPTGYLGNKIREARDAEKRDPYLESYLFACDFRHCYMHMVLPDTRCNTFVFDRSFVTSYADSNFNGNSPELIALVNRYNPAPDILFILDCSPEIAVARVNERNIKTGKPISKRENMGYIAVLRPKFLALGDYFSNAIIINTELEIEESFDKIKKAIEPIMGSGND